MSVQTIRQLLSQFDGAIRHTDSLRSATFADILSLRTELEEAAQDAGAGDSTKVQIESLIREIDRAKDDEHQQEILINFLLRDETRLKAMLSLAEQDEIIALLELIGNEWKIFMERQRERENKI